MPTPDGVSDDIVRVGAQVTLTGVIESVVDGLLVRGTVAAPARVVCVRCLRERDDEVGTEVIELFGRTGDVAQEVVDPGYVITDDTIDLETLLRDAVVSARPQHPLCSDDCAGLCPTCGADRNTAPCGGHEEPHDQRWSALAGLELPDTRNLAEPGSTKHAVDRLRRPRN